MVTIIDSRIQHNDVIPKMTIRAMIQTITQRVQGNIHIREWERVKDWINNTEERFLAVTDAVVVNYKGEILHQCSFMIININHIVWMNPDDDEQFSQRKNGGPPPLANGLCS